MPGFMYFDYFGNSLSYLEFCKNLCKLGSSCSYMIAGMPFLCKSQKC